jgi:Mn2+/Fe2+ NRAMP family transporter
MKELLDKLKITKEIITIIIGFVGAIITCYSFYRSNAESLKLIQKTTLRTMIWSKGVPLQDKLEACDSYLDKGYNSETRKYCEKLIEEEFK